jgi:microcystin-dependent protein
MANPFVAEIRVTAFNFAPTGWAQCNGQLMPISQNTALFSLLGTFYGGDGKSTFALPNLQAQAAVSQGQGPGLSEYFLGQSSGVESITLLQSEMPLHTHGVQATPFPADQTSPNPNRVLARSKPANAYQSDTNASNADQMDFASLAPAGGGLPHNNMPPVLVLNFIIALQGVFPPRS